MLNNLEKNYEPNAVEDKIYANWLEKNYFHAEIDKTKEPFTIVIPPPNITGQLHMGHALDNTVQDILIRHKRMAGYNALWIPGCDHASISTELKIVEKMAEEGLTKDDIGREEFLKRAWAWKDLYGNRILEQLKKLGSSCDWQRERFTLDEGLSDAVLEVFVRLYNEGLIYKKEKLINWCPKCMTTISDAEVSHEDMNSFFYHLKYPINGTDEFLPFATTRPETILGDTAIAVNPNDERYKKYVGMTVTVPIVDRVIPIIADEYVEMDFGVGVVKITPAHDPNDFEVGLRHNLPIINVLNDDATVNENGGSLKGLSREEARAKVLEIFTKLGLFIKKEDLKHAVGTHERCGVVVEPLIKLQWFVKMEPLAAPAIAAYKNKELNIIPERFGKIYLHWLENIKDWCISRQLWWGHRIPAYTCEACGHMEVAKKAPSTCQKCGSTAIVQDEDSLDTWFSSALWPFSTLGWPNETEDLAHFYPTSVLVTSYDIIFFWVVRMVFSGLHHTNKLPFKDVFIHGLVRDEKGRKMSKSLGNGVDPLEVIDKYGTDSLRLMLLTGNSPGNDMRFNQDKVEASRNFLNKIWNSARFILMHMDGEYDECAPESLTSADKWILSKVNRLSKEVTENIDDYELGIAVQKIYDFVWDEYCDWYIEMVKPRLYEKNGGFDETRGAALYTLKKVLITALKLLHPYTPFITEEIFLKLQTKEPTIMLSSWPTFDGALNFPKEEKEIEILKEAIKNVRNTRAQMNVPPSKKAKLLVVPQDGEIKAVFEQGTTFLQTLASASEIDITTEAPQNLEGFASVVTNGATLYIPFDQLIDFEKELVRKEEERKRLIGEVERVEKKLGNQGFVSKAPKAVIDEELEKSRKYKKMLESVEQEIEKLKKGKAE